VLDVKTARQVPRSSLLLASGYWGVARHFHYVFELVAAWSWCLLANPLVNGATPLLYCVFLTILLLHRAKRDEAKCLKKYGADYERYAALVPYLVIPGVY
jgi:7-dehydrocholesterol reductase